MTVSPQAVGAIDLGPFAHRDVASAPCAAQAAIAVDERLPGRILNARLHRVADTAVSRPLGHRVSAVWHRDASPILVTSQRRCRLVPAACCDDAGMVDTAARLHCAVVPRAPDRVGLRSELDLIAPVHRRGLERQLEHDAIALNTSSYTWSPTLKVHSFCTKPSCPSSTGLRGCMGSRGQLRQSVAWSRGAMPISRGKRGRHDAVRHPRSQSRRGGLRRSEEAKIVSSV